MSDYKKISRRQVTLSQTVMLTFLALFCFFIGTFFVLEYGGTKFHEVAYEPATIIDSILSVYDRQEVALPATFGPGDKQDTVAMEEIRYRRYLLSRIPDADIDKKLVEKQLFVYKDSFVSDCLVRLNYGDSQSIDDMHKRRESNAGNNTQRHRRAKVWWDYYISYSYKYNKPIQPYHLRALVKMPVRNYSENIDFFTRYPGFLLWSLLIILQYGLFPVLALCAWVIIDDFKKQFHTVYNLPRKRWEMVKHTFLCAVILSIFAVIGFQAFFNPNLIESGLFHRKMSEIMVSVSILTCVTGTVCFTGFMLISASTFAVEKTGNASEPDIDMLNEMNELFSKLLIICSIVLCMIVLTTGALYNSLNKMDFIKKVTSDLGYSPLGYHYALLFAALCSFILLLFFVPAKLRLLAIEDRLREINPAETRIGKPADIFAVMKSVLVVGLPMITGLIQSLLSALSK